MATDNTIASIEEQQNILRQKAAAARKAALNAPTEAEREKYMAERDSYNQQIKQLTAQQTAQSTNDPTKDTYAGFDQNSGKDKYYNPKTGEMYLSETTPSSDQRRAFNTTVDASGQPIDNVVDNNPQQTNPPTAPPVARTITPINIGTNVAPSEPITPAPPEQNTVKPVMNVDIADGTITRNDLLSPQDSVIRAQDPANIGDNYGTNAAEVLAGGQAGTITDTTNTPVSKEQAPIDPTVEPTPQQNVLAAIQKPRGQAQQADVRAIDNSIDAAQKQGVDQAQKNVRQKSDWRVKLQLAQEANYLYKAAAQGDVLYPLQLTDGVIFPYTPQIQMSYKANYDVIDLVHNNYKQYFYKNSSVEDVIITCDFTAQDTSEADYLLAVIHFFRSVTKMFYGQDGSTNGSPRGGTPPPLCFLSGLGQYQFSDSPVLINNFSYTLPNDVDYIRAGSTTQYAGVNLSSYSPKPNASSIKKYLPSLDRLLGSNLTKGGIAAEPAFQSLSNSEATYVPTKIQLQIGAYPIVTRKKTTDEFSLTEYATGKLLQKGFW